MNRRIRQMGIESSGRPIEVLIEKRLCIQIVKSSYFKMFYQIRKHRHAINEIYNQVNHVEPWMVDDSIVTGFRASVGPSTTPIPSKAFCLLYHLFTMKLTKKQVHDLLDHPDSPYIRAIGFLYLRYVAAPDTLWTWYKDYIEDKEEFSPGSNGKMTTMGVYVRDVLLGEYYFGSRLPPVPLQILQEVRTNLEEMRLPTKLSGITSDPSVRERGRSHDSGHAKSPPRNHRSQSDERNHEAGRSHSDRDHPWYSVREPGRDNRDIDYRRSRYSEWDAERRSRERRNRGSDRNVRSSGCRRGRSRSRSRGRSRSRSRGRSRSRSRGRSRSRSRSSRRRGPERSDKGPDRNGRSSGRRSRS